MPEPQIAAAPTVPLVQPTAPAVQGAAVQPNAMPGEKTGPPDTAASTPAPDDGSVGDQPAAGEAPPQFASLPRDPPLPPRERIPSKPAPPKVLLLHVGPSIRALDDLDGRKVAVEDLDPQLQRIVSATFQSLGINPVLVDAPGAGSTEQLRTGEVGATLVMVDADRARVLGNDMMRIAVDPWLAR